MSTARTSTASPDGAVAAAYARTIAEVAAILDTGPEQGLSDSEAAARLARVGPNRLDEAPRPSVFSMFLDQFRDFIIWLLIGAAIIAAIVGTIDGEGYVESVAILAIVVLNAVIGVVQEYRAENALRALEAMATPEARVVRDGQRRSVPSPEIVPGDVVVLETGNYVPADLRLTEAVNLQVSEAALTGESLAVTKLAADVLPPETGLGDRRNMAFAGTVVTYGRGQGLVTATGMHTSLGEIATMLQSYEREPTPLQQRLEELGKTLGVITLAVCAIVFAVGLARNSDLALLFANPQAYLAQSGEVVLTMFMTAVSLAIAAVPEGLPAVVTIVLSIGMQRMARRHALIRRLAAVETLGSTTVICTDKTGTLTKNEMSVVQVELEGRTLAVHGEGYGPDGEVLLAETPVDPAAYPDMQLLAAGATLCSDAIVQERDGRWQVVGDPTEGALVAFAARAGLDRAALAVALPRVAEIPFDSDRKRMTTVHRVDDPGLLPGANLTAGEHVAFTKGAADVIMSLADQYQHATGTGPKPLNGAMRGRIEAANHAMAAGALRVLGLAWRRLGALPDTINADTVERELVFVGLTGLIDPPRPEAAESVGLARSAGIRTIMITGDHADTARAIAESIGLVAPGAEVLTGQDLNALDDGALVDKLAATQVFARVSPEHKVRIVDAVKARGEIAAMTGDGINDAPAMKRAHIGVAMGITGTDVSKETADMVLTDDNFASIVSAVEEGRVIFDNIRKFVFYLLSCNIGEILIIFLAMLFALAPQPPLLPIQLLWLNLVTDGLPALALGLEPASPNTMNRPPRDPAESVLSRRLWPLIGVQAAVDAFSTLAAFTLAYRTTQDLTFAQTVAYTTLVTAELIRAYTSRSQTRSLWSMGVLSNPWMVRATVVSFLLLLGTLYLPALQNVFRTVPLDLETWGVILVFAVLPAVAAEVTKWWLRRRHASVVAPVPTHV